MKSTFFYVLISILIATFGCTGSYFPSTVPDYAGIYQDGGGSMTILLVEGFEQIKTFDTDGLEVTSNGAHGTDNITLGATGVYSVEFHAHVLAGANNKDYEIFAFEIAASPVGTSIIGITKANPAVITTATSHGLGGGEKVKLDGVVGMTEVEDNIYTVVLIDADEFSLDTDDGTDVNSGTYGAVGTDGFVYVATQIVQVHGHVALGTNSDQESVSGGHHASLTGSNTVELYIKGITDATDVTIEDASFYISRVQ